MRKKEFKVLYGVLTVVVLAIMTIGTTYAYWTATTQSSENAVNTQSTIYSISMNIDPLYFDFSFIPMNDTDVLKALRNQCKDKYDRGACSAYKIRVYDYNEGLSYISGFMDVTTNHMTNLSYLMLRISDEFTEESCVLVEDENYCVVQEATPIGDGKNLSLGDAYDVTGLSETKFILVMWLTNLNTSQNESDIGSFDAVVTMQAGNGGEIKGSISSALKIEDIGNGE